MTQLKDPKCILIGLKLWYYERSKYNLLVKQTYKDKSCEFNKEWLSDQGSDYKCITQEDYG